MNHMAQSATFTADMLLRSSGDNQSEGEHFQSGKGAQQHPDAIFLLESQKGRPNGIRTLHRQDFTGTKNRAPATCVRKRL